MCLTYNIVLSFHHEHNITGDELNDDIKSIIDEIRDSLGDFIRRNNVSKKSQEYLKRRNYNKKNVKKPDILGKDKLTKVDTLKNDINSDFNKLSPKNFDKLATRIIGVVEKNNDLVEFTIQNCFLKATSQYIYCEMYVKFIKGLYDKKFELNSLLNHKCEEFLIELMEFKDNDSGYETKVTKENYDKFCEGNKKKQFKRGYSQFIALLFKNELVSFNHLKNVLKVIRQHIQEFMEHPQSSFLEDNITCFIETLDTSFSSKNSSEFGSDILFLDKMKNINKLPKRLKFKVMDVQDKINKKLKKK